VAPCVELTADRPGTGLSVTSVTPVLWKFSPALTVGATFCVASVLIASTPSAAILPGYCCEVAPMTPFLTSLTPVQPPSIETIVTPFLPAACRALLAPIPAGSLIE
jgi:hypothetical protein